MKRVARKAVEVEETDSMVDHSDFYADDEPRKGVLRAKRIASARHKEHVRLALTSVARHGYFVFDELVTEDAGILDFLAVGPLRAVAITVRHDEGCVGFGGSEDEITLDGKPFKDDPIAQSRELADEIDSHITGMPEDTGSLICFTQADFEIDENRKPPLGATPIWELPWALDPEGRETPLTPADIEEIAEKVQRVYGRPPIITPNRDRLWEEGV